MEVINDWGRVRRAAPRPPGKGPSGATSVPPDKISERMAGFEPTILSLHFYEDVDHPWVQVVFEDQTIIHPELVLQVGEALANAAEADCVYFNSLRPMAIYFLIQIEPAFDLPQNLLISRYGTPLKDVQACWRKPFSRSNRSADKGSDRFTGNR